MNMTKNMRIFKGPSKLWPIFFRVFLVATRRTLVEQRRVDTALRGLPSGKYGAEARKQQVWDQWKDNMKMYQILEI